MQVPLLEDVVLSLELSSTGVTQAIVFRLYIHEHALICLSGSVRIVQDLPKLLCAPTPATLQCPVQGVPVQAGGFLTSSRYKRRTFARFNVSWVSIVQLSSVQCPL